MYINKNAFTFVELIVVITILAVLATISFGAYQSYLSSSKDSNRIIQLEDIHDGLELLAINQRLPLPEDMVEIQANGNSFSFQGSAGESIINAIGYEGGGTDPENGSFLTYVLSDNKRDFQLMTYISDKQLLTGLQTFANQFYIESFPVLTGKPIGTIIDEGTNSPIQEITDIYSEGTFDVINNSTDVIAYLDSDTRIITSQGDNLTQILPATSCKRLLEVGKSNGNGKYLISPNGSSKFQVYCDMETDGGGWTFGGYISENTNLDTLRFNSGINEYTPDRKEKSDSYFLEMDSFDHTEMMLAINNSDPNIADANNALLFMRYGLDSNMFHIDDMNNCVDGPGGESKGLGKIDGLYIRAGIGEKEYFSTSSGCNSNWYVRPELYNPQNQGNEAYRENHLAELPYTQSDYDSFDSAGSLGNYPSGLYFTMIRDTGNTPGGVRYSPDAWVWMKGDWTSTTQAVSTTYGNKAWIYVR